ncbi:BnaA09g06690D [Brassica napus]|uniref:Photosystem I reaction center subunit N, chloroplastic n=1 Tax=Brassica napus TaxID=3708 RepID=A0A078G0A7_BRANA|nr:BnaA09g06690D [Brassica napus]
MAAMNSSVLTCSYAISGAGSAELNQKVGLVNSSVGFGQKKQTLPVIKAAQRVGGDDVNGRRSAMVFLAATLFSSAAVSASANASVFDEYLEKSKANKELNDKKRLATSGANFARAFTVQFGSCKFPENFTDGDVSSLCLSYMQKVPFISEDLALECEGKDKFKCGSNVFWKW